MKGYLKKVGGSFGYKMKKLKIKQKTHVTFSNKNDGI